MWVNVAESFMLSAAVFLNCKKASLPFKYLGLLVGANPRRLSTWQPLLDVLLKRLTSWKNRYLSLGGGLCSSSQFLQEFHHITCPI